VKEATLTKKKLVTNPRCHAHKKSGEQCRNQALNGMTVCRFHGGATKASREKARERLLAAADPAAAVVIDIASSTRVPAAVRLAAAKDILDRVGLSARTVVEMQVEIDPGLLALVEAAHRSAVEEYGQRPALQGSISTADAMDDVIDAELAEDDYPQAEGYLELELPDLDEEYAR